MRVIQQKAPFHKSTIHISLSGDSATLTTLNVLRLSISEPAVSPVQWQYKAITIDGVQFAPHHYKGLYNLVVFDDMYRMCSLCGTCVELRFHLSALAGPTSQLLNPTHEFSDDQNGPAHESEPLSSPAPVGQNAVIWRVVAGKMNTRALDGQNQFLPSGQNANGPQMEISSALRYRIFIGQSQIFFQHISPVMWC